MNDLELSHCTSQEYIFNGNSCFVSRSPLILAVDDDEDNLLLLTYTLELLNCSVLTAADGYTALFQAQTHQPDLILLDVVMPNLDGVQLVHCLRQDSKTQTIPVVAVTALAREEDKERCLLAGFNDYISKPYILEDLEDLIRHHLNWTLPQLGTPELKMDCKI